MNRSLKGLLITLLLALCLAGCGEDGREGGTSGPVVVVSIQASVTVTPGAILPSASHTPVPPSASPVTARPSHTPPPALPSPTPTAQPTIATPTRLPPAATPTPAPTATPTPASTSTPTPTPDLRARDPATIQVELQLVVAGLETPVGIASARDGSNRLFILEKVGRVRIVQNGAMAPSPFLDISDRVGSSASEQGLLGLAFHPAYSDNGFFFINYTDHQGDTVIARFSLGADPAGADPASETVLLTLNQPAANHNGGHLAFGPDGYLYVGTGDGGASGDKFGNGQNGQTLLGAMLRLDVDGGQPYAVPAGNPFIGNPAVRDEIWATGLRNPWRYSFDRRTGDLYIADVGQNQYEELDVQGAASPGGQNYGWPIMEATHCFPENRACNQAGLTLPVVEYDHAQGCSVTGGYVYRGQEFPLLTGIYLFGDYCSGRIWGLAPTQDGAWRVAELAQADLRLSSFGEDGAGELYLLAMNRGELYKIVAHAR